MRRTAPTPILLEDAEALELGGDDFGGDTSC